MAHHNPHTADFSQPWKLPFSCRFPGITAVTRTKLLYLSFHLLRNRATRCCPTQMPKSLLCSWAWGQSTPQEHLSYAEA